MGDPRVGHFPLGVTLSVPAKVLVASWEIRILVAALLASPEEDSSRVSGRSENRTGHHSG
jgi:hypothetical protein